MPKAKSVTETDWDAEVLQSKTPVLVDFWAEWCQPCRVVAPVVEEIAGEQSGHLKVVKVNVDDYPHLAQLYGVMSIPTLVLIDGGIERKRLVGGRSKGELLAALGEFIA